MGRARKYALVSHPVTPLQDMHMGTKITLVGSDVLKIEYVVVGAMSQIAFPPIALPDRADGLWRHTCFEAFFALGSGYIEFNFSPSRHYAMYRFDGYREGMQPALNMPAPHIYIEGDDARFLLTAWIDLKPLSLDGIGNVGLSAVIEETDGTKSYWALAHAPGQPDFHNRDCFIATLPAPTAP